MAGAALIAKSIVLKATYEKVAATTLIASVTITNESAHAAYLLGAGPVDVVIGVGRQITLAGVDLSGVQLKGTANDIVTVIGQAGAWMH